VQNVQIKKSTIPIIRETKKNAIAPTKIAAGIAPVAKVVTVRAKMLVIIAPIAAPGKIEFSIHLQLSLLPHTTLNIKTINTKAPCIKVIKTKVRIEVTRPAKNTAATPAATSKLAIILKIQEHILFLSLYINIPPLIYNMREKKTCVNNNSGLIGFFLWNAFR